MKPSEIYFTSMNCGKYLSPGDCLHDAKALASGDKAFEDWLVEKADYDKALKRFANGTFTKLVAEVNAYDDDLNKAERVPDADDYNYLFALVMAADA